MVVDKDKQTKMSTAACPIPTLVEYQKAAKDYLKTKSTANNARCEAFLCENIIFTVPVFGTQRGRKAFLAEVRKQGSDDDITWFADLGWFDAETMCQLSGDHFANAPLEGRCARISVSHENFFTGFLYGIRKIVGTL